MNVKVEFGIFVLTAVACNECIFNFLSFSICSFLYMGLTFWMALEKVETLADDLLDEILPMHTLCVFMHYKSTVLKALGSARDGKR